MANCYEQFFNFSSSLYEDGFPIFPITQVFFLAVIYFLSGFGLESSDSGEEYNFQKAFFYSIITVFLARSTQRIEASMK